MNARFNEWCTQQYASSSYLHEIGRTAREEMRDQLRDRVEAEWRRAGRQPFEVGLQRGFNAAGSGHRLGGGGPCQAAHMRRG